MLEKCFILEPHTLTLNFFFFCKFYLYECMACMYACVPCVCLIHEEGRRGHQITGTEVRDGYEPPSGWRGPNPDLYRSNRVPAAEPSSLWTLSEVCYRVLKMRVQLDRESQ